MHNVMNMHIIINTCTASGTRDLAHAQTKKPLFNKKWNEYDLSLCPLSWQQVQFGTQFNYWMKRDINWQR